MKKKKLRFEVEFIDNKDIEELILKIIKCLNTSTSKVKEIK